MANDKPVGKDQEVFYQRVYRKDRDLHVYANPVGEAKRSYSAGTLGDIAQALAGFNEGLKEWVNLQRIQKEENTVKAMADYAKGASDKPSSFLNIGVGYDEKWETLKGSDLGIQYNNLLKYNIEARKADIYSADDKTRAQILDDIKKEAYETIFAGRNHSDYTMAGAYDHIKNGDDILQKIALDASIKQEKEKRFNSISSIITNTLLNNEEVLNNPLDAKKRLDEFYAKIIKDNEKSAVSISRDEFSHIVIDNIGVTAIELAKKGEVNKATSLLQIFKQKGDGGFSLDEIKNSEGNYKFKGKISDIEQVVAHELDLYERKLEKQQKQLKEDLHHYYVSQALSLHSQEDLRQLIDLARKDDNVDVATVEELYRLMTKESYNQTDTNKLVDIYANLISDVKYRGMDGLKILLKEMKNAEFDTSEVKRALSIWRNNQDERKRELERGRDKKDEDFGFYLGLLREALPDTITNPNNIFEKIPNNKRFISLIDYYNKVRIQGIHPSKAYTEIMRDVDGFKDIMMEEQVKITNSLRKYFKEPKNWKDIPIEDKSEIINKYIQNEMIKQFIEK